MRLLNAPTSLRSEHGLTTFDCSEPVMNDWLKRRALGNQSTGASRTFVVTDDALVVRGYYALAAGAVDHIVAVSAILRNMPDPVPVMVLGRLAVDRTCHRKGVGADLLQDAILRTVRPAREIGIRALVVHALHDQARKFYLHHGFSESAIDPLVLMICINLNS
ncbi:MAG: GNAT family N-acetyltransferase [Sulfuriferula multivorans]|uniref:GNAT family N-acetyltransferase n=1 Tax=Sulfuriferula multivorans TaxID=1559896 RepID=A0A7C9P8T2_9PROT|nr:GNAT family N-acetyltransferase [Sulfuriferula multivorans]